MAIKLGVHRSTISHSRRNGKIGLRFLVAAYKATGIPLEALQAIAAGERDGSEFKF